MQRIESYNWQLIRIGDLPLGGKVNRFSGFADEASLRQARLAVDRRKTLLTRAKTDRQNSIYDLDEAQYRLLAARGELLDFLAPRITAGR